MRDIIELGHLNFKSNLNSFLLHWDITSKCTYRCSYCDYRNRDESFKPYYEKQKILEFIEYISKRKDLIPILFGGEPTLDPDFLKVIQNFPKLNNYPISLYTNLCRSMSFFKDLCDLKVPIRVMTSFHYTESNKSEFRKKVLYLLERGTYVRIKIMWDFNHKDIIRDIFYEFKKLEKLYTNCFCSLDIVYGEGQKFSKEDLSWYYAIQDGQLYYMKYDSPNGPKYEETSFNRIKMRAYRFHGGKVNLKFYRCECGKRCLFITSNGDVHYCQTMRKNKRTPIFNIHQDDYNDYLNIFEKNIVCTEDNCLSEISVPKHRVLNYVGKI